MKAEPKLSRFNSRLNRINNQYSPTSSSSSTYGSWSYSSSLPTYYQVTDTSGLSVYYMGTLCTGSNSKICDFNLQPGCYIFRVDGAFDNDINGISWTFCGARGGAKTQLSFCINNDLKCKGSSIMTAEDICMNYGQSDFTSDPNTFLLSGRLNLGSTKNIVNLSDNDIEGIRSALVREFIDVSSNHMNEDSVEFSKLSWKPISNIFVEAHEDNRRLDNYNFMIQVNFELNIVTQRFATKSSLTTQMNHVHDHLHKYLSISMNEGIFLAKLKNNIEYIHSGSLQSIISTQLVDLELSPKDYISNTTSYDIISIFAIISIIGSIIIGIIFSYITYNHSMSKKVIME